MSGPKREGFFKSEIFFTLYQLSRNHKLDHPKGIKRPGALKCRARFCSCAAHGFAGKSKFYLKPNFSDLD
jgi:hypothetical protein